MGGRLGTWQATPTQGPGSRAAGRPHGAGWPREEGPSAREPEVCRGGGWLRAGAQLDSAEREGRWGLRRHKRSLHLLR